MGVMDHSALRVLLFCTASHEVVAETLSGAMTLLDGADGLALDFTDDTWLTDTGYYGSAAIVGGGTQDGYDSSPDQAASSLLTYTSPSLKMTMGPSGTLRFQAHNLYLNSAAPANQSITVVSGATYAITITGSVSVTASGAATGTWTSGTNTFTAATTTLTLGSTSGSGTVHLRRTPSDDTYLATGASSRVALPFEWSSDGTTLQGIRVEEARTNLLTYSIDLSDAAYAAFGTTKSANSQTSPDGTTTACSFVETSATSLHILDGTPSFSVTSGTTYTFSIYLKPVGRTRFRINAGGAWNTGTPNAFYDTSTVGVDNLGAGVTASITDVGGGYYRLIYTVAADTTSSAAKAYVSIVSSGTTVIYAGDTAKGMYLWGAQVEAGSFATSYIPTIGSTVTRAADSGVTLATSAYPHSATVNTAMIEYVPDNVAAAMVALRWDDGTSNEVVSVGHDASANLGLTVTDGGAAQTAPLTSGTVTAGATKRVAVSWKANDFLISNAGAASAADTSGTVPTVTSLDFGPTLTGVIKKVVVFNAEYDAAALETLATA